MKGRPTNMQKMMTTTSNLTTATSNALALYGMMIEGTGQEILAANLVQFEKLKKALSNSISVATLVCVNATDESPLEASLAVAKTKAERISRQLEEVTQVMVILHGKCESAGGQILPILCDELGHGKVFQVGRIRFACSKEVMQAFHDAVVGGNFECASQLLQFEVATGNENADLHKVIDVKEKANVQYQDHVTKQTQQQEALRLQALATGNINQAELEDIGTMGQVVIQPVMQDDVAKVQEDLISQQLLELFKFKPNKQSPPVPQLEAHDAIVGSWAGAIVCNAKPLRDGIRVAISVLRSLISLDEGHAECSLVSARIRSHAFLQRVLCLWYGNYMVTRTNKAIALLRNDEAAKGVLDLLYEQASTSEGIISLKLEECDIVRASIPLVEKWNEIARRFKDLEGTTSDKFRRDNETIGKIKNILKKQRHGLKVLCGQQFDNMLANQCKSAHEYLLTAVAQRKSELALNEGQLEVKDYEHFKKVTLDTVTSGFASRY